ncbi:hypothetical protein G6F50_014311 [Rhizopus delemar]|uniref:Uncharacterized protein n=1 Tax=Rhizopus delemar TaxID=936053 RepID=A0A9P7C8H8_9FUNG|nr:hypothetical protein G6F50_014311 [Rhizopus delemar]
MYFSTKLTIAPLAPSRSPRPVVITCLTGVSAMTCWTLVLEFARGVQRVDVDHGEAGTQHAEGGHRVLQAVGHHQGDAVTLLELELAQQVGGELGDQRIGLTIGDDLAEAGVGGTVAEFRDGGVEDRGDRMELVDVDFGGNAFRIALQPGTIQTHIPPPGIVMY